MDDASRKPPEHTPEEEAAFNERLGEMADYAGLLIEHEQGLIEEEQAEVAESTGWIKDPIVRMQEAGHIEDKHQERRSWLGWVIGLLLAAILMAVAVFYFGSGNDATTPLAGEPAGSNELAEIAPPGPVATSEEVLPPEVFTVTCADCGEVTQVPLELNKDAKYQYAYDAGGARIAILTVVEAGQYDALASSFDEAYEQAQANSEDVEAPRPLDGAGEAAIVFGTTSIFKSGEDCGILWANTLQNAEGEAAPAVGPEQLEELTRIAASRM